MALDAAGEWPNYPQNDKICRAKTKPLPGLQVSLSFQPIHNRSRRYCHEKRNSPQLLLSMYGESLSRLPLRNQTKSSGARVITERNNHMVPVPVQQLINELNDARHCLCAVTDETLRGSINITVNSIEQTISNVVRHYELLATPTGSSKDEFTDMREAQATGFNGRPY